MAELQRAEQRQTEGGREEDNGLALEPYNKLEQEVIQREAHTHPEQNHHTHSHTQTCEHMCVHRGKMVSSECIPPPPPPA